MILAMISWLIALPLDAVLFYVALESTAGLLRLRVRKEPQGRDKNDLPRKIAILVPAHNEAAGIGATVASLKQKAPSARILVVADNCRDETAELARKAGAETIERFEPESRGKGFALAFGRDHLAYDPPTVVLVIDADCCFSEDSAQKLALHVEATGGPVQAVNLQVADADASPLVKISNFAMVVKNVIRARGLMRLGGGTLLFGTGMAFPWSVFSTLPLATADAVEDLRIGLWLARRKIPVELEDRAAVFSPAPTLADSSGQRSRWEHGFLSTAAREALPLMRWGIVKRSRTALFLGAHLLVPPLALLMSLSLTGLLLLAALLLLGDNWSPFLSCSLAFSLAVAALLCAWWLEGRRVLPLGDLLRVPIYVAWKMPIYFGFFKRRQSSWNRTRRKGDLP